MKAAAACALKIVSWDLSSCKLSVLALICNSDERERFDCIWVKEIYLFILQNFAVQSQFCFVLLSRAPTLHENLKCVTTAVVSRREASPQPRVQYNNKDMIQTSAEPRSASCSPNKKIVAFGMDADC